MRKTVYCVIHDGARADRARGVADLYEKFGDALRVAGPVVPAWERDPFARSVRGCALAHLFAVRDGLRADTDVVVFEDDVARYEAGQGEPDLSTLPADAGIVLLGAETESLGARAEGGWFEVLPKFWGTHAVLYRAELAATDFLLNALAILAANSTGSQTDGYVSLCYESVLCMAVRGCGVKIYRPEVMAYTTVGGWSSREACRMPARSRFLDLRAGVVPGVGKDGDKK